MPGYYGCNQIKYVRRIAFTAEQTDARIMSSGYRFRPIGESGAPTQPSMHEMSMKSWINSPSGRHPVAKGPLQVHGIAFSGGHGIAKVEVSLDDGATWSDADLRGPDLGPYAWRLFVFETDVDLGTRRFVSRATDLDGNVQAEQRVENHRGYGHNGWRDLGVEFDVVDGPVIIDEEDDAVDGVVVGPAPGSVELSEDAEAGRQLFAEMASPPCSTCHTFSEAEAAGSVGPNLDMLAPSEADLLTAVTNGVGAMPAYGESLTDQQIRQIAAYVREVVGR